MRLWLMVLLVLHILNGTPRITYLKKDEIVTNGTPRITYLKKDEIVTTAKTVVICVTNKHIVYVCVFVYQFMSFHILIVLNTKPNMNKNPHFLLESWTIIKYLQ